MKNAACLYVVLGLLWFAVPMGYVQSNTDVFLTRLLAQNPDALFQVIQRSETDRLLIIYTRIGRDRQNQPSFTDYRFQVDRTFYFNPVSTVKLHLSLLAFEKINYLKVAGIDKFTAMQFVSPFLGQTKAWHDETSPSGYPSLAHLIKKAFL